MKFYSTILAIAISLHLFARDSRIPPSGNFAVLKGHIRNNKDTAWNYSSSGYLSGETHSVPIDKNGIFFEKVKIETPTQSLMLKMEVLWELDLEKNDTVEIDWDARDVRGSLVLRCPVAWREKELRTLWSLGKNCWVPFIEMAQSISKDQGSNSEKFARINELYNREIDTLLAGDVTRNTEKMVINVYYRYAIQLSSLKLLPGYDLVLLHPSSNSKLIPFLNVENAFNGIQLYQMENEYAFKNSSWYRNFIYNYVRTTSPFFSWSTTTTAEDSVDNKDKIVPFQPAWNDYYAGLRSFHIKEIRDWFIAKSIIDGFQYYSYEEVSAVYQDFISRVTTPLYIKALKEAYADNQRIKQGTMAPDFVLRNEQGQQVSLSSLRGKIVYLDFWGVHCGPCIEDIKTNLPLLHEKYKDKNLVFVNICVDAPEKEWKDNLVKLHLSGINLIAEDMTRNPVCKAYLVNAIPRYYVIDQEGNIVFNNRCSPGQGYFLYTELDKLLEPDRSAK